MAREQRRQSIVEQMQEKEAKSLMMNYVILLALLAVLWFVYFGLCVKKKDKTVVCERMDNNNAMSILSCAQNVCFVSNDRALWPVHVEQLSCFGDDFKRVISQEYERIKKQPFRQVYIGLDVNRDILQLLEYYVNNKRVRLEPLTAWKMIDCAQKYKLNNMLTECMDYFECRINLKTCVQLFKAFKCCEHPIVQKLHLYFVTNFEKIVDNCMDFYSIDFKDIRTLIENDYLNISSELKVWRVLARWVQFAPSQRIHCLRDIIITSFRYARLHLFEIEQISKHPLIRTNAELCKTMTKITEQYRRLQMHKDGYNRHCDETRLISRPRIPQYSLIVHGGCTETAIASEIESYSYHTNQWKIFTPKEMFDKTVVDRYYHSVECLNAKYYIIGGSDYSTLKKSIVEVDFRYGTCREMAEMTEYRCYVSTAVLGDYIYAIGGLNGTDRLSSAERYDPKTDTWSRIADMNVVRSDASACVHNGKIYIAGGLNSLSIEASLECYDPAIDSWILMESMLSPRSSFSLVAYADQLYALGGNDGFERLCYVETYDFRTNQWLPIDPMNTRRSTFKAIVLNDELYAIGGYDGEHATQTVEKFSAKSQSWLNVGKLNIARTAFALVCFKEY